MIQDSGAHVGAAAPGYRAGGIARIAGHLTSEHAVTIAVAGGSAGIAFAGGGYSAVAFSAASLVLWSVILVGVAAGVLPRAEPPGAAIGAGGCLTGLTALIGLSVFWAVDDGTAFEDMVRASAYLGLFVLVVAASRRGEARVWLRGLAIGLFLVAIAALATRLQPGLLGGGDQEIAQAFPQARNRLSYPIGYWNGLAALMAIAGVLFVWLGARAGTRIGRALAAGAVGLAMLTMYAATSRGGFVALGVGLAVLLLVTRRRFELLASLAIAGAGAAALLAFATTKDELLDNPGTPLAASQGDQLMIVGLAIVAVAVLVRYALDPRIGGFQARIERFRAPPALKAAAVGAVIGAGLAFAVVLDLDEKWESFKQPPDISSSAGSAERNLVRGSSSGRYQYWGTALDAFESRPLRGIGAGGYETYWNRNGPIALSTRQAHSLFLESAAELGIGGAALSLGFFGVAGFAALRRRGTLGGPAHGELAVAAAILGAGFAAAAIEWTWDLPAVFGPVVVAAALLTGPATLPALAPRVAPPMAFMRSRRRFAGGVAILLVAWAAICGAGLLLLANRALDDAREAAARGDAPEAIEQATEASELAPWSAEPHLQLVDAYVIAGDLPSAQVAIEEAIDRRPDYWRYWLRAAQLDFAANDVAGARANFDRARELLPNFERDLTDYYRESVATP